MFKIGEFSKLTQVSIRMLRYYDETGLLRPAQTDSDTGYRLYEAQQIPLLNKILFLRDVGCTVAEMQAVQQQGWADETVTALLTEKRRQIAQEVRAQQERLAKIEQAGQDLGQNSMGIHYNVAIKAVEACNALCLRRRVTDYYAEGALWKELFAFAHERGIQPANDTFALYHDAEYREQDVDIEVCMPVAQLGEGGQGFAVREIEAVPLMAGTMVYGGFENIAGAFVAFARWLQTHSQYRMTTPDRQIVHRGPWNETDPGNYLTEIQIPLQKR